MKVGYVHTLETPVNAIDTGTLRLNVVDFLTEEPIKDASVELSYTGEPQSPIEVIKTNANGQTEEITLDAPPIEYSMEPQVNQPYAEYTATVTAPGYDKFSVSGIDVFSGQISVQTMRILKKSAVGEVDNVVIGAHTLFGNYPPKIPESEIKPINVTGEIVLSKVVVPETIVVHDGVPQDSTAANYYVNYAEYIKNVASSEIYPTWPKQTLIANILAIMSFTLNRVYTEFYRNQGYNFTITSSTAYDHKFIYGRNIFSSISEAVDEVLTSYLSRPNVRQPILTQYCDGQRTTCPTWLSQWGSKYLGDQDYSAIEILRYYYGSNMYINTAEQVAGIPYSWPGYNLDIGSSGQAVAQLQEQLNLIGEYYSSIPVLVVDGIFGENTKRAVRAFQKIFDMPQSGIVDFPTWYKLSDRYVRLSGIAELY